MAERIDAVDRHERIFRLANEIAHITRSKSVRMMAWEIEHHIAAQKFGPLGAALFRWPPIEVVPDAVSESSSTDGD